MIIITKIITVVMIINFNNSKHNNNNNNNNEDNNKNDNNINDHNHKQLHYDIKSCSLKTYL